MNHALLPDYGIKPHRKCGICGAGFEVNLKYSGSRRKMYCGARCCDIARQCRETGRTPTDYLLLKQCPECGKPISGKFTKTFCSRQCHGRNYTRAHATVKQCKICSKEFRQYGHSHTCSGACSRILTMVTARRKRFTRFIYRIKECRRCAALFERKGPAQKICASCIKALGPLRRYQADLKRGRTALPPSDQCGQCGRARDRAGKFCSLCITERIARTTKLHRAKTCTQRREYNQSIAAVRNFLSLTELTKSITKSHANTVDG
jgi:predicted nucleic acid-binding Zn ribbon protein